MVEGTNEVAAGKLIFQEIVHGEGDQSFVEYNVELVEAVNKEKSTGVVINPRSCLTGNLAFLSVMLGKEDFETWWCNFCEGYRTEFQQKGQVFEAWTIKKLMQQHQKNVSEELTGTARMGVRRLPHLKEGTIVILPGLHGLLGIGNQIVNYNTYDRIDQRIERITPEELLLCKTKPKNEELIRKEEANKDVWMNSVDGGLKLKQSQQEYKVFVKALCAPVSAQEKKKKKSDLHDSIKALESDLDGFGNRIKEYKNQTKAAKKKLEALRKQRKRAEHSLYGRVEKILAEYNIKRAAYHGGDLNGVNTIRFMDKAKEIMEKNEATLLVGAQERQYSSIRDQEALQGCEASPPALEQGLLHDERKGPDCRVLRSDPGPN